MKVSEILSRLSSGSYHDPRKVVFCNKTEDGCSTNHITFSSADEVPAIFHNLEVVDTEEDDNPVFIGVDKNLYQPMYFSVHAGSRVDPSVSFTFSIQADILKAEDKAREFIFVAFSCNDKLEDEYERILSEQTAGEYFSESDMDDFMYDIIENDIILDMRII